MPKIKKTFDKADYDKKYQKENYERINIVFKNGTKARVKAAAEKQGKSLNAFMVDAIMEAVRK